MDARVAGACLLTESPLRPESPIAAGLSGMLGEESPGTRFERVVIGMFNILLAEMIMEDSNGQQKVGLLRQEISEGQH